MDNNDESRLKLENLRDLLYGLSSEEMLGLYNDFCDGNLTDKDITRLSIKEKQHPTYLGAYIVAMYSDADRFNDVSDMPCDRRYAYANELIHELISNNKHTKKEAVEIRAKVAALVDIRNTEKNLQLDQSDDMTM